MQSVLPGGNAVDPNRSAKRIDPFDPDSQSIVTFQTMMRPFSILEVVRTGVIAVQKGGGKI